MGGVDYCRDKMTAVHDNVTQSSLYRDFIVQSSTVFTFLATCGVHVQMELYILINSGFLPQCEGYL